MEIQETSQICRAPQVLGADVTDVHVLLSPDLEYVGIDAVGRRIWDLIEQPVTWADLVATLVSEFDVDESACRRDTSAFIETMVGHGLVQVA
jgi:hypothetical protein